METRANFVLIGLFTLAVIVGAFGFVYWFQHVGGSSQRVAYRVVFKGPVTGLRTGASVVFNGIRVGEVSSVGLADPRQVVAELSVDRATPVRQDTSVGLEFQGLTGIASVALRGGSVDAPALVGKDGQPPTLMADSYASQEVTEAARATLQRVDRLIDENQIALRNTLKSIESFTATLSKNSERVDEILTSVDKFTTTLANNSERIDNIIAGVERLSGTKDKDGELHLAVKSIRELAENLDKRSEGLIADGRRTLRDIDAAVRNFDRNPTRVIFGGPSVFPGNQRQQQQQRR